MATTSEPLPGYWASPCSITAKRVLLAFLVACFVSLSGLVYFDPAPGPALSEVAREGRRIWHDHNCQSCHQLYGFGGFLGPDLTNAALRVRPERLRRLLVEGSGVMPAFGLTTSEIDAVDAFLEAMNETGQGQAKAALLDTTEDPSRRMMDAISQMIADSDDAELCDGLNVCAATLVIWLSISGAIVGYTRYQHLPPPEWLRVCSPYVFALAGIGAATFLFALLWNWIRLAHRPLVGPDQRIME